MVLIFIVLVIVLCLMVTKASYDTATQIITLEETTFNDSDYEVDEDGAL